MVDGLEARLLRIFGKVQRVGFRRFALELAQELGLTGYVKNLPDGSVEILIQGEEDSLTRFLKLLEKPPLGKVRKIKVEEMQVDPHIKEFKIEYGELADELQEGFGAMQSVFMEYWKEFKDYREEFRSFASRTDENLKGLREEFSDYREEFRSFASRTDGSFREIMERYGEISRKLTVILETLIKESNETRKMINESLKAVNESLKAVREALDRIAKPQNIRKP